MQGTGRPGGAWRRAAVRSLVLPAALAAALTALTGCSSGPSSDGAAATVHITERDFHIAVSPSRVPAGHVTLTVRNRGPENHELIVVRLGNKPLPLRTDGVTVNEEALDREKVGGLEPGPPGDVRELRLKLRPGHYEVFCNMSGHYLGGMHAELTVS